MSALLQQAFRTAASELGMASAAWLFTREAAAADGPAGVAAMRETLRLLGEGGEPTFLTTQHGMGLIPAEVRARRSLGPAPRR